MAPPKTVDASMSVRLAPQDFQVGFDRLDFSNLNLTSSDYIITDNGTSTFVDFSGGARLTFAGVVPLTSSDFDL